MSIVTAGLDDVDGYKNLQQLLNQLDKALHVAPATKQTAAAAAGDTLKVAAARQSPTGGLDEPLVRFAAVEKSDLTDMSTLS